MAVRRCDDRRRDQATHATTCVPAVTPRRGAHPRGARRRRRHRAVRGREADPSTHLGSTEGRRRSARRHAGRAAGGGGRGEKGGRERRRGGGEGGCEVLEHVGQRVRDEPEALLQLFDQRLRPVEQRREVCDLLARHLERDADRGAGGGGDGDRLLVVAGQRRQVEVLVAAEPRAGRELVVRGAEPLREDAGVVPGDVNRRLASAGARSRTTTADSRGRGSRAAARRPRRIRSRRSDSARPRSQGIGGGGGRYE